MEDIDTQLYTNTESCINLSSITISEGLTQIDERAFEDCTKLTSITLPNSIKIIGFQAFKGCTNLTSLIVGTDIVEFGERIFGDDYSVFPADFYCYAETPPSAQKSFIYTFIGGIILHVPASALESYRNTKPWSDFGIILPIDDKKQCAAPIITFENGKLHFSSDTEGTQFICKISSPETEENGETVNLLYGEKTYTISVYATAEGYADSEVATTTVTLSNVRGDIDGNGFVTVKDVTELIDLYLEKGQ